MHKIPNLKLNRYGVYYFRLIFTKLVRDIPDAPKEVSISLMTKNPVIAQERYMIIYPYARSFRWSLHESVLAKDIEMSDLKLKLQHWKKKNQLLKLLADESEKLMTSRIDLLHRNNENRELLDHTNHLTAQNHRLKGALVTTKSLIMERSGDKTKKCTSKTIRFSSAIELYIESKKGEGLREKSLQGYKEKLFIICDLLKNPSVTDINRLEAERIRSLLFQYPTNRKKYKIFNGLDFEDILKKAKKSGYATLSATSVKDYIEKCSSFYQWLVLHEYCERNPFRAIKINDGSGRKNKVNDKRDRWSKEELIKLFSTNIYTQKEFKHPYYYWLPLLGLYTGARIDELCQLYIDNIKQQDNLWYFEFTDEREDQKLKNGNSERAIPIHSKLIELGFLDFVKSKNQAGRLFPELKKTRDGYSTAASKWFGRLKTRLGCSSKVVFHSLRHTVADELKQAGADPYKAGGLAGHQVETITFDRYGKTYRPEVLVETVEMLKFDFLTNIQKW